MCKELSITHRLKVNKTAKLQNRLCTRNKKTDNLNFYNRKNAEDICKANKIDSIN